MTIKTNNVEVVYITKCENNIDKDNKNITTNETSFAQSTALNCYCCGKTGHKSPNCPEKYSSKKTNGLLNMQSNICKQKRIIGMTMKI